MKSACHSKISALHHLKKSIGRDQISKTAKNANKLDIKSSSSLPDWLQMEDYCI